MADAIRFYFDQHMPLGVADGLRLRGIEALTAQDAGRCGLDDDDQLQFAAAQKRVMVTFDADYLALAASRAQHAGIAYCHATKHTIGRLVHELAILHGVLDADDMVNRIEYL